jgi:hypothetical protein
MVDVTTGSVPISVQGRRKATSDSVAVNPVIRRGVHAAGWARETRGLPGLALAQSGPPAVAAPAACGEREEELVPDARSGFSPAQIVEQKLMALLYAYHGVSVETNPGLAELRNPVRD